MKYLGLLVLLLALGGVIALGRHGSSTAVAANPPSDGESTAGVVHVDANGAAKRLSAPGVRPLVIDVRTPREYQGGHLEGATNIDFYAKDFAARLAGIDRGQTCLVHCAVGGRSTKALETLRKLGFTNVIHLDGGLKAWEKAGKPVVKPAP